MGPGGSPSPWRSPRLLLTLLLIFVTGAATGAICMRYGMRVSANGPAPPSWKDPSGREVTLQVFRTELNLTDDQASEVELVLDDFMKYYQTLQAQMDEVRATGKDRILKILNEEQKAKFTKMMDDLQNKPLR